MSEKNELSRDELATTLLNRLRQEPGMESLSEVCISEIHDPDGKSNWRASVLEKDRPDISRIIVVVERLQDELREIYQLAQTGAAPSAD